MTLDDLKLLAKRLKERDDNAVEYYSNSGYGNLLEAKLGFVSGRAQGTLAAVGMIVKHLIEKEDQWQQMTRKLEEAITRKAEKNTGTELGGSSTIASSISSPNG